jgi:hypothetical protein
VDELRALRVREARTAAATGARESSGVWASMSHPSLEPAAGRAVYLLQSRFEGGAPEDAVWVPGGRADSLWARPRDVISSLAVLHCFIARECMLYL